MLLARPEALLRLLRSFGERALGFLFAGLQGFIHYITVYTYIYIYIYTHTHTLSNPYIYICMYMGFMGGGRLKIVSIGLLGLTRLWGLPHALGIFGTSVGFLVFCARELHVGLQGSRLMGFLAWV